MCWTPSEHGNLFLRGMTNAEKKWDVEVFRSTVTQLRNNGWQCFLMGRESYRFEGSPNVVAVSRTWYEDLALLHTVRRIVEARSAHPEKTYDPILLGMWNAAWEADIAAHMAVELRVISEKGPACGVYLLNRHGGPVDGVRISMFDEANEGSSWRGHLILDSGDSAVVYGPRVHPELDYTEPKKSKYARIWFISERQKPVSEATGPWHVRNSMQPIVLDTSDGPDPAVAQFDPLSVEFIGDRNGRPIRTCAARALDLDLRL